MKALRSFFRSLYLTHRFFTAGIVLIFLFVLAFPYPVLLPLAKGVFTVFAVLIGLDFLLLYAQRKGVFARRDVPDRLSNGDQNPLSVYIENNYLFKVNVGVIDEIPHQFQKRDLLFETSMKPNQTQIINYDLRPTQRGEYSFGAVNVFVATSLGLVQRRYEFSHNKAVAVYPSFLQMRQYEFMAISNRLVEIGIKKVRRLGQSMEFEQIRPYTIGDDVRAVNWKATARRNELMINAYQEERSQAIYAIIDKGRVMKMPFEELSLLDYAINATLVLGNIALYKQDKAGLITFADAVGQVLVADKRPGQLQRILETLYKQTTNYAETNYEALYTSTRTHIKQRSLLLLFTNFETLSGMRRQLPYLRKLVKDHLLVVVFFENTELRSLLNSTATTTEGIYQKTIAEKYFYEKQQIVRELAQYGIQAMLTPPQQLTVNTVNKYLEMKARGMI